MRSGGGKQKGASFERDVCRRLSLWVSNNKQEDVFWRSAMSGGRATVGHAKGKRMAAQAGDISCIHHTGSKFADLFTIECKFYRDLNYTGLITGKGHLVEFWHEAMLQGRRYSKHPMLIAKQNQYPPVVCLDKAGYLKLGLEGKACLMVPPLKMRVVLFDDFLKHAVRPK